MIKISSPAFLEVICDFDLKVETSSAMAEKL
jgi:hypothetical protein